MSETGKISFFDNFFIIEGCATCKTENIAGFEYLLKGEGTCHSCMTEKRVTTANQLDRSTTLKNVKLNQQHWPTEAFVEVVNTETRRAVRMKGAK